MKTTIPCALTLAALASACIIHVDGTDADWQADYAYRDDGPHYVGSGVLGSRDRSLPDFARLQVTGPLTVLVFVGEESTAQISGDANLLDLVELDVEDECLELGLANGTYDFEEPLVVRLGVPRLTHVDVASAAAIDLTGLVDELDVEISSAASVVGRGQLDELEIELNAAADVDFSEAPADEVELEINGTGVVRVHADRKIEIEINGTGSVIYAGKPASRSIEINGVGQVRHVDVSTDI